jgi:hypothetical protein
VSRVGWPGWAFALLGPGRGPVGLDSPLHFFFVLLLFLIFSFLFLSQILHIESKQGQTKF